MALVSGGGSGTPSGNAGGDLTGTYPNPTIGATKVTTTKLAAAVTLDAIATANATAADVAMNSHKITGLTNGAAASDAAAFGQIPSTIGNSSLIYRYTVTGSVKASIDTGVDTPNAGSNVWTGGDLLEILLYARTDEVATASQVNLTFNNDGSSIYDVLRIKGSGASTLAYANSFAGANWFFDVASASAAAGVFGSARIVVPNYAGTVGQKVGEASASYPDTSNTNSELASYGYNYRSTSAITRLKVIPNTGAKNFAVGSQLLIYKRLNA